METITVQEAAEMYRCSEETIRRRIKKGILDGYQPEGTRGYRIKLPAPDIEVRESSEQPKLREAALIRHEGKVLQMCESIKAAVPSPSNIPPTPTSDPVRELSKEKLWEALRQHQPMSQFFGYLEKWQNARSRRDEIIRNLYEQMPDIPKPGLKYTFRDVITYDPREYTMWCILAQARGEAKPRPEDASMISIGGLIMGVSGVFAMTTKVTEKEKEDAHKKIALAYDGALRSSEYSEITEVDSTLVELHPEIHSILDEWIGSGSVLGGRLCFLCRGRTVE